MWALNLYSLTPNSVLKTGKGNSALETKEERIKSRAWEGTGVVGSAPNSDVCSSATSGKSLNCEGYQFSHK